MGVIWPPRSWARFQNRMVCVCEFHHARFAVSTFVCEFLSQNLCSIMMGSCRIIHRNSNGRCSFGDFPCSATWFRFENSHFDQQNRRVSMWSKKLECQIRALPKGNRIRNAAAEDMRAVQADWDNYFPLLWDLSLLIVISMRKNLPGNCNKSGAKFETVLESKSSWLSEDCCWDLLLKGKHHAAADWNVRLSQSYIPFAKEMIQTHCKLKMFSQFWTVWNLPSAAERCFSWTLPASDWNVKSNQIWTKFRMYFENHNELAIKIEFRKGESIFGSIFCSEGCGFLFPFAEELRIGSSDGIPPRNSRIRKPITKNCLLISNTYAMIGSWMTQRAFIEISLSNPETAKPISKNHKREAEICGQYAPRIANPGHRDPRWLSYFCFDFLLLFSTNGEAFDWWESGREVQIKQRMRIKWLRIVLCLTFRDKDVLHLDQKSPVNFVEKWIPTRNKKTKHRKSTEIWTILQCAQHRP